MKKMEVSIFSILYIVIGLLVILFKDSIIKWIAYAIGVIILIIGIIRLVRNLDKSKEDKNLLMKNIIFIIIGIAIILFASFLIDLIRMLFGILLIIYSIYQIVLYIKYKENNNTKIIYLIVMLIIGLLLFINHSIIYYIIGVLLIISGILEIFTKKKKSVINKDDVIDI